MSIDLNKINLRKESVIDLKKKAGIGRAQAQVVSVIDYSGSMGSLYANGTVQDTVERILPFGLAFDDNGDVDSYIFHDSYKVIEPSITKDTVDGYVNKHIYPKLQMGGTSYAPVLKDIFNKFKPSSGLFGLGKEQSMEYPVYIIFITDGDNSDHAATEEIVREMSKYGFFIQFIGIGRAGFNFLDKLDNLSGRAYDNANFFKVSDIKGMSDDALYQGMMAEYPEWWKQMKLNNLIK